MTVQINIVEVASELASMYLVENYEDECSINGDLFVEDKNGVTIWNDKAQKVFDELYDTYYDFILLNSLKTKN